MKLGKWTKCVTAATLLLFASGICLAQTGQTNESNGVIFPIVSTVTPTSVHNPTSQILNPAYVATVVPVASFVFVVILMAIILSFRAYQYRQLHKTIALAIEKGTPISPEMMAQLTRSNSRFGNGTPLELLRKGLMWSLIGIALLVFLWVQKSHQWAAGFFPLAIGIAYLIVWKVQKSEEQKPPQKPQ